MQNKNALILWGILALVAVGIYVFGGNSEEQKLGDMTRGVEQQLGSLEKQLDGGTLRNALILKTYTEQLKKQKPELTPLLDNLEKDATSQGAAFQRLKERLQKVKDDPKSLGTREMAVEELIALKTATDPKVFNDALVDQINVVADLSGGTLSRLQNGAKGGEAGSSNAAANQLVGNPQYGYWRQSNGMSFWEWYGAYAMFRDLLGGRSVSYNDWQRNPPPSYYNNYGRNFFERRGETPDGAFTKRQKQYGYDAANQNRRTSSYGSRNSGFNRNSSAFPSKRTPSYSYGGGARRSSSYGRRR